MSPTSRPTHDAHDQTAAESGASAIEEAAALLVKFGHGSWVRSLEEHGDDGRPHCARCGGQRRPCTMFVIAERAQRLASRTTALGRP